MATFTATNWEIRLFKTATFPESGRDDRHLTPLALRAGSQFAANYIFEKGKFRPKYRRCSDKQIL
jgi:hypothetical protein